MAIPDHHTANFDTLMRAFSEGNVALLEVRERSTGKTRTALVAVDTERDGGVTFVPFAIMTDSPYDEYDPPVPGGGFAP